MSSPYAIGRRWYCDRKRGLDPSAEERGRPPFTFVIVGKGSRPGYKLCRLEEPGIDPEKTEQEYSHKHLKRHATLVEEP